MKNFLKSSLASALATAIYTSLVASLMIHADYLFGKFHNVLGPIAFLMLFVFSAALTGGLVLGQPVLLYLDGKRKEAIRHFAWTMYYLFIILVVLLVVLAANK